jgi:sugar phosphate isomerase/epimerase
MLLSYNTNGLVHHELTDAIALFAEIGYRGVAITLDHSALNPYDERFDEKLASVSDTLAQHQLRCVIETGARYLLDPQIKHEPTLVTADPLERARRVDFLCRAIDVAARLRADCVSLWSGVVHDNAAGGEAFARLASGLQNVLSYAAERQVALGFEPEPGMFIDTMDRFAELYQVLEYARVDAAPLRLTLDIGHLHCQGELPIADQIRRWAPLLANVHIEDMRSGVHEHLMFGEGEIDFPPVIAALAEIGYAGLLGVELSRHSHIGPAAARQAYNYLQPMVESAGRA